MQPDDHGKQLSMDSFELKLKNDKVRSYKRIVFLVAGISVIFFLFYSFYANQGYQRIVWAMIALLVMLMCFIELKTRKDDSSNGFSISITYLLLIACWMFINIWMAFAHVVLLMADSIARRSLIVLLSTNNIVYPTFPKKNIDWSELENVVLKDGLLTIDFKNNHLLQSEIISSDKNVGETAFNIFCKKQLKGLS